MDNFETAKKFFVEGLHLLETNSLQAAEMQFARSLELIPDRVSTLNNLSAIKNKLEKFAEAEAFALKAAALDDKSPDAWSNLGFALTKTGRPEEALQAFDRAIKGDSSHVGAWLNKATTLFDLKRYDEALQACDQALKLDSRQHEFFYARSLILKELNRPAEAQETYLKSIKMRVDSSPAFITERRATQQADVLVINRNPDIDISLRSFETLQVGFNFPGQFAKRLVEDFHFTYVFADDATKPPARKQIPPPGFVINNCANGEVVCSQGNLWALTELVESFGVPVVNHPAQVVQTTRDATAKRLADVPGIRVPKTMRFSSIGKNFEAVAREIEDHYDYPLITRTLISQVGKGMTKVGSRNALVEALAAGLPDKFFVTEFVASKGENKFFRKIRAAIVKDEIIVIRVDCDTNWNVHARKSDERVAFYLDNLWLLDAEKKICAHPEDQLGRSAILALRAIRERIPLDVFGVDFDVDADGTLVFYEANATMNLFSTVRPEVDYPKDAEACLKRAFQRYFMSLVAGR